MVVIQSLSHVGLFATQWIAALPGFPVLHHLPELAQAHVHRVSDAIQPSRSLLAPSPPALASLVAQRLKRLLPMRET